MTKRRAIPWAVAPVLFAVVLAPERTEACGPLDFAIIWSVVPADADVGVPVDIAPRLLINRGGRVTSLELMLRRSDGTIVDTTLYLEVGELITWNDWTAAGWTRVWYVLAPVAPLAPFTTYTLEVMVTYDAPPDPGVLTWQTWTFTTGDTPAPAPPVGPTLTTICGDFHGGDDGGTCLDGVPYMSLVLEAKPGPAADAPFWRVFDATVPPSDVVLNFHATPGELFCVDVATRSLSGAAGAPGPECCILVPDDCDVPDPSWECQQEGACDFVLACGDTTPPPEEPPPEDPPPEDPPRDLPAIDVRPSASCAVVSAAVGGTRPTASPLVLAFAAVAAIARGRRARAAQAPAGIG